MSDATQNKQEYVRPELVMITYAAEDVIFTSGGSGDSGDNDTGFELPQDPF